MLPELLYEICKWISPDDYLELKKVGTKTLGLFIDTFKDPLEAKYIYRNVEPIKELECGLRYIALTNPNYSWPWSLTTSVNSAYRVTNMSFFEWLCCIGNLNIIELLLNDKRVDPSADDNLSIHSAALNNHLEVVKLLMSDGRLDTLAENSTGLSAACSGGHLEIAEFLSNNKQATPFQNDLILSTAAISGHLNVVKFLLNAKTVSRNSDVMVMVLAARHGHKDIVQFLLQEGIVIPDSDKNRLIEGVKYKGHHEIAELLLTYW